MPAASHSNQFRLPEARQRIRPCSNTWMAGSRSPLGEVQEAEHAVGDAWCRSRRPSLARRSASSPWRRPSANAPSALKARASHALRLDRLRYDLVLSVPDPLLPAPPRSAATPRPPGRYRQGKGTPAPGDRRLSPQGKLSQHGRYLKGLAGPLPWRRRGLPEPAARRPSSPAPFPAWP